MKHTIDDVKKVNPEFRMYHNLFDVNETKEDEK